MTPATVLSISAELSPDNTTLTIADTTQAGVASNGYNQVGGLQLSDVTLATLIAQLFYPDTTSKLFPAISLFPTIANPSPFVAGEAYQLDMSDFGSNAGAPFFEGVMNLLYTITGSPSMPAWAVMNTGLSGGALQTQSFTDDGTNIYIGTQSGVYFSSNEGAGWSATTTQPTTTNILSLTKNAYGIFAGTSGGGVFFSTDMGVTWTAVNTGLTNLTIKEIAAGNGYLYAGTSVGFFVSNNNGTAWTEQITGLDNTNITALLVDGVNIYIGVGSGSVYFSSNNGTTWYNIGGTVNGFSTITSLAVEGTNLFAGDNTNGVFLTSNNGTSWTQVNTGLTNTNISSLSIYNDSIYAGTSSGGGIFMSNNNGVSWQAVNNGLSTFSVYFLFVDTGENFWTGTVGGGVYLATSFTPALVYTVSLQIILDQKSWCCINKKISNVTPCGCGNSDEHDELWKAYMYLKGAEAAVNCNKPQKALQLLGAVQKFCGNDCGCS